MAKKETRQLEPREMRNFALYGATSIPDALERYIESLKSTGNFKNLAHAKALEKYHDEIVNKKYLSRLRINFNEIYSLIDKNYPNLRFLIEGRRKSFISTDEKIIKLLEEKRSLDLLRDTNGFRILLFGEESEKLINNCYSIMDEIIRHLIEKGCTLCEAEPVKDTESFNPEEHKLIIPKKSGIPEVFKYGIKDYILTPKENGYQSIHAIFRTATGECFEIQIRTFAMHLYAESGKASHTQYKTKKYKKNVMTYEKELIGIPGYGISEDGKLFDFIGLEKSLQILQRQKTF